MAIVVVISGKRGAGKDLLGKYLSYHKFKGMPFAGELKDRVRRDFGLTKEQTDGALKETPTKLAKVLVSQNPETKEITEINGFWTPREIMISYGQFFRQFDSLYWVKKVFDKINAGAPNDLITITDVRFKNEADYVKEQKGYLVRIERKPELNIYKGVISDASEVELDNYTGFDLVLPKENNETPQDLEQFAYRIVDFIRTHPR